MSLSISKMKYPFTYYSHLIIFQQYFEFGLLELKSLLQLSNISYKLDLNYSFDIQKDPLVKFHTSEQLTSTHMKTIFSRSVLVKTIFISYTVNSDIDSLVSSLNLKDFKEETDSDETFRFDVEGLNVSINKEVQLDYIQKFNVLDFKAKVNLKSPSRFFVLYYNKHTSQFNFGKVIGRIDDDRRMFYSKYNLQDRKYLGPTSLDNKLSFLMTNFGLIQKGDLVFDPFAGTGSLLIPPSHFGAIVFGSDIDIRVLKGYKVGYTKESLLMKKKGKENIFTNFIQYGLASPSIFRGDINSHHYFKEKIFDCILCDPPYGIRAMTRQSTGQVDLNPKLQSEVDEENKGKAIFDSLKRFDEEYSPYSDTSISFSPLIQCSVNKLFEKLLYTSSLYLRQKGRMICLYPVLREEGFNVDDMNRPINFPQNESFILVDAVENIINPKRSRWCLIYEKK